MANNTAALAKPFRWNYRSTTAAFELAKGIHPHEVAEHVSVTKWTIAEWRKHPDFDAKVQEWANYFLEEIMDHGLKDGVRALQGHTKEVVEWLAKQIVKDDPVTPNDAQRWELAKEYLALAGIKEPLAPVAQVMPGPAVYVDNRSIIAQRDSMLADELQRFRLPPAEQNGHAPEGGI